MFSFVTINPMTGTATRLIQTGDSLDSLSTIYYVNCQGYVEFDGCAYTVSASWLRDCIGRWLADGNVIKNWSK